MSQILDFAQQHDFAAIELRGLQDIEEPEVAIGQYTEVATGRFGRASAAIVERWVGRRPAGSPTSLWGTTRHESTPVGKDGIMIAARLSLGLLAVAALSAPVPAQGSGSGFLFQAPRANVTLRAGYARASAQSDLFSFTADQLTLTRRDFSSPAVDLDVGLRLGSRTDLVLAISYAGTSRQSEFRRFVDQDDNPIQQTTTFQRVPVSTSLRQYLTPRGRAVGNSAWIPARLAPYLGVGGAAMWYRFRQVGDFVHFEDGDVFPGILTSSGWTVAAQAMAGAEYSVSPRLALTAQGSYLWGKARPSAAFSGFDRIDLSGLATTVGLSVRF